jgi:hypothetical protein
VDQSALWRQFFATWPDGLPQKGIVVTNYDEQVVFVKFLMSEHFIMLERLAPDSLGGRRLVIPYGNIQAVKLTEPTSEDVLTKAGYLPGGKRNQSKAQ